jgi:hypothetical protein
MSQKKVVYFLGAGASYCFGYPLTTAIMPGILQKLQHGNLFGKSKKKSKRWESKNDELLYYLNLIYPGLKATDPDSEKEKVPGITEVLSLIDYFCLYNLPVSGDLYGEALLRCRQLMNEAMGRFLLEYDLMPYTASEEALLQKFVGPIRNEKKTKEVSIITTNYDLVIDLAFEAALSSHRVDYGIPYRDVDDGELIRTQPRDPLFRYYKLHGSLNWLKCESCGQYYINPYGSIVSNAFRERLDDNNTCVCSARLRLSNVLITPSFVRDIRDSNLLQIWKGALEAIRTADKLVIIGYSLPPEDLGIKSIFIRALNSRKKGSLAVDVVQMGDSALGNYESLFGRKKFNYHNKGLAPYLQKAVPVYKAAN